jgi:hypothetical protein
MQKLHGAIPGQGLAFLFRGGVMVVFGHEKAEKPILGLK